eukprot:g1220.t1
MDHEALTELARLHPHETCIVFRRMIVTGSIHSFLFISHNFWLLCVSDFALNPVLYSLCAIRIFMGIPRPYLWYRALDMLKKAQDMPTPARVTSAFLDTFLAHPLMKTNEMLGTIFMAWLSAMILWLSISRFFFSSNDFEAAMLIHCILYMGTQLLLSIIFVALLHHLIHSDIERGLSSTLLDKHTVKRPVEAGELGEECPICYSAFTEGEVLRCLPCSHYFHQSCIDPWLMKKKNTCPMCLTKVGEQSSEATQAREPLAADDDARQRNNQRPHQD